ncbi:radical SAM protein [Pyrobaculum aerophilum]|uniref:Radical SAM protein n=1 Tax=Pyrobaculum aerophilum TaxID=13773 RepID=A0A371R372_9CREN|nr:MULTISPECIES: radical SAM protein [Pyrobaculum]MCX8137693.1 radical SAM protein [Pyrobaculum aerophilum]RFA95881.1 radical SAM protein [Pyrobaculum aerophilum]RFA98252.1 radical SAM protein [Pyrobaculum aerophilum]
MRLAIIDGYTDEPAGLGVPPYLDVYARYVAGAAEAAGANVIHYFTIDGLRENWSESLRKLAKYDIVVLIAGVTTPGKYLGGTPITLDEILDIGRLEGPVKVLGGPVAKFGYGIEGGTVAVPPSKFRRYYDIVASGDVDLVVYRAIREGVERAMPSETHRDFSLIDKFAVLGAKIVTQHPNYGGNLIVELETYRSCPRYVSGGCSFCTTVAYGPVITRPIEGVVEEVKALYAAGVVHFRLGRQADFYAYMAHDIGREDFPRPNPSAIERLLLGIRNAAPGLKTLHIDNVNPGTVARWQEESVAITKLLVKYGTPGNVAAMGVESADPRVIKLNNLKVDAEEALRAVEIFTKYGSLRGYNGMPYILAGINFVAGLPGETSETYRLNVEFLQQILDKGLLVRRVNIRQVLVFPTSRLWPRAKKLTAKLRERKAQFLQFKKWVREVFDREMLRRIVPRGTILREVYTEAYYHGGTYARQVGSYPLLVYVPTRLHLGRYVDVVVVDHGARSVLAVPYPVSVNTAGKRVLKHVPGITREKLTTIIKERPFKSLDELREKVGDGEYLNYVAL